MTTAARLTAMPAAAHDTSGAVASLYSSATPVAQRLLAETAAWFLREAGRGAAVGQYGFHATCETDAGTGVALVLVPMADLSELDAELADEDDQDPGVWHVLARDTGTGTLLEPGLGPTGCPSVLRAVRAGIDPSVALALVEASLADPDIAAALRHAS